MANRKDKTEVYDHKYLTGLPGALWNKLEVYRGQLFCNRAEFTRRALAHYCEHLEKTQSVKPFTGE